jgi:hypothetical protein
MLGNDVLGKVYGANRADRLYNALAALYQDPLCATFGKHQAGCGTRGDVPSGVSPSPAYARGAFGMCVFPSRQLQLRQ